MRIRSIHPEFYRDDAVGSWDWHTRLVFIGIWSYVDDNGVGRDNIRLIAADLFPLEENTRETLARVSRALQTLSDGRQVVRYEADGERLLYVRHWSRWQRVDRPGKSRYPLPTCDDGDSPQSPEPSRESRETLAPGEGEKGRRGEEQTTTSSVARKRETTPATRIPEDFAPTADLIAWAREKCPNVDWQDHEAFMDYWRAQPGVKGRKTDWPATWRNWMRRAQQDTTRRRPTHQEERRAMFARWDQIARDLDARGTA